MAPKENFSVEVTILYCHGQKVREGGSNSSLLSTRKKNLSAPPVDTVTPSLVCFPCINVLLYTRRQKHTAKRINMEPDNEIYKWSLKGCTLWSLLMCKVVLYALHNDDQPEPEIFGCERKNTYVALTCMLMVINAIQNALLLGLRLIPPSLRYNDSGYCKVAALHSAWGKVDDYEWIVNTTRACTWFDTVDPKLPLWIIFSKCL